LSLPERRIYRRLGEPYGTEFEPINQGFQVPAFIIINVTKRLSADSKIGLLQTSNFFVNCSLQLTISIMPNGNSQTVPDQARAFEKAEMDLLRESLLRSHKERFLMATRLYKIQQTMSKAIITRKPYISK
jgi:hypothetical protein